MQTANESQRHHTMRMVSQAAVLLVTAITTVITNAGFLFVLNTAYYREIDT